METQVIANIGSSRAVILGNNTWREKRGGTLRPWLHFIKISSGDLIGLEKLNYSSDAIKENYENFTMMHCK